MLDRRRWKKFRCSKNETTGAEVERQKGEKEKKGRERSFVGCGEHEPKRGVSLPPVAKGESTPIFRPLPGPGDPITSARGDELADSNEP